MCVTVGYREFRSASAQRSVPSARYIIPESPLEWLLFPRSLLYRAPRQLGQVSLLLKLLTLSLSILIPGSILLFSPDLQRPPQP